MGIMNLRVLAVVRDVAPAVGMLLVECLTELALHVFGRGLSSRLVWLDTAGLVCIFGHGCSPSSLCCQPCHGRTSHTTVLLTGTLALSGVPLAHARRVSRLVDVIYRYAECSRQLEGHVTRANRSPGPLAVMGDQHHGRRGDVGRRFDERLDSASAGHEGREVIADGVAVDRHSRTIHPTLLLWRTTTTQPSPQAHPTTPTAGTANNVMRQLYGQYRFVVPLAAQPQISDKMLYDARG